MPRIANPRRVALAQLDQIKKGIQAAINRFKVSGTVYESVQSTYVDERTGDVRPYTGTVTRKRRPEEYPENQAGAWATLYHQAGEAMANAQALREMALDNYHRCLAQQQAVV